ncbi:hypothetical protein ABH903_001000 [Brevibacterium epidermidis]|jgi:hypothetical protein|uniref:Uncharacterized protein n=1 Tax=Brevibacterium epidermidis TaxID=1698 RepID=A0ABV4EHK8_BREEP
MPMANGSADYIGLANAPILWILAMAVMGVVVVQSLIYMTAVKKNAESAGMSQHEVRSAFRAGGVAAIGPSLSVVLLDIALLPLFGTPPRSSSASDSSDPPPQRSPLPRWRQALWARTSAMRPSPAVSSSSLSWR